MESDHEKACSSLLGTDITRFFEVLLFSFLIGNSDMHLKNFSLLREHDGSWHLSPAYDLVPVKVVLPADKDDLALTVNGKNRKLRASDFRIAAKTMGLTDVPCDNVHPVVWYAIILGDGKDIDRHLHVRGTAERGLHIR